VHIGGAEQRARQRAEAADHHHREQLEAALGQERLGAEARLLVHVQGAGHGSQEARQRERRHAGPGGVDPVGPGRLLVLADGDEHPAGAAAPQPHDHEQRQAEHGDAGVEHRRLAGQLDAEERAPVDAPAGQPVAERRRAVEQERRHEQAERQRAHRQRQAPATQRRVAHDHGGDATHQPGRQAGERQVPAPVVGERPADRGAHPHERHVPQADLPGPPGEHHQRRGHDAEDHDDGGQVEPAGRQPRRQGQHEGADDRPQPGPTPDDLGQLAHLARYGPDLLGGLPGRRRVGVDPAVAGAPARDE